jgi:hypothetical protein
MVSGATANTLGGAAIPTNSFPFLNFFFTLVPNAENSLPKPVLLPRLNTANNVTYNGTTDLVLTCQGMEGLKMTIKANSMRKADGSLVTTIEHRRRLAQSSSPRRRPYAHPGRCCAAVHLDLQPGRRPSIPRSRSNIQTCPVSPPAPSPTFLALTMTPRNLKLSQAAMSQMMARRLSPMQVGA